jgi:hypothetical protein
VARQAFDEAERELRAAVTAAVASGVSRFGAVGVHWLLGLLLMASGDAAGARDELQRELVLEESGHLYARECCGNAWYALGALAMRENKRDEALLAFERAGRHSLARIGRRALGEPVDTGEPFALIARERGFPVPVIDLAIAHALPRALTGDHAAAARLVHDALRDAPPGSSGWSLPVEPLLHVAAHRDIWSDALTRLRERAA